MFKHINIKTISKDTASGAAEEDRVSAPEKREGGWG